MATAQNARHVCCQSCDARTTRVWRTDIGFGPCSKCGGVMVLVSSLPNTLANRRVQKAKRELREQENA